MFNYRELEVDYIRAFQRAIDEVRKLPLTPQRVAQKANLSFL